MPAFSGILYISIIKTVTPRLILGPKQGFKVGFKVQKYESMYEKGKHIGKIFDKNLKIYYATFIYLLYYINILISSYSHMKVTQ